MVQRWISLAIKTHKSDWQNCHKI